MKMDRRGFLEIGMAAAAPLSASQSRRVELPLISLRVGVGLWLTDAGLQKLQEFLAAQPGTFDEVLLFTSHTHPPLPLDEMLRRAKRLAQVMPKIRETGPKAGINLLSTLGHLEENLDNSLSAPWQRARDPWGKESKGCFCPAQPELLDYAARIYAAMAEAGPDSLWIDDDVRMQGHRPINYDCFCDLCLRNFAAETGTRYTRESLLAAFDNGPRAARLAVRKQWLEHNRRTMDNLFQVIERAVHRVKPGLPLGFMTCDRSYEGSGFTRWTKTLAGPDGVEVRWRPGCGFYSDENLLGMVGKAHAIGRQVAALPPSVRVILSEIENFPYQPLRKSVTTVALEASAYMAAGTTGTAYNIINGNGDPLDEYLPLYKRIAGARKLHSLLRSELGRSVAEGLWPAWNQDSFITVNADGAWLEGNGRLASSDVYALSEIGIPIAYAAEGAAVTALAGSSVLAFSEAELRRIFSRGVLMDVAAWKFLREMSLAGWTGLAEVEEIPRDASEVLSKDPLNGRFAGYSRDCRQSFWWQPAWRMTPSGSNVRQLARLTDYAGKDLGPCLLASENELGGRVVVAGYYPWTQVHNLAKTSQMKSFCRWLARDRFPVEARTFAKVAVWLRAGERGRKAAIVINTSLDRIARLELAFASPAGQFTRITEDGADRPLPGGASVTLTDLAPWTMNVVLVGR